MGDVTVREDSVDEQNACDRAPLLPSTEQSSLWRRWANRLLNNGILWLLLGQILYTFVFFFYKVLVRTIPIFEVFIVRCILGLPLVWASIKILRLDSCLGPRELWPLLFARSLVGCLQIGLLFSSLYFLPLGDMTALFRTNPVFSTILAGLLQWEGINALMVFGSSICVIGGVFISHPPLLFGGHGEWGIDRIIGIGMALGAAIASAFSYLFIGRLGKRISPLQILLLLNLFVGACSIPFVIAGFPKPFVWEIAPIEWAMLLGLGLCGFSCQLMITWGLQVCKASMGTAICSSQLVLSYLAGYFFLHEGFSLEVGIGILCIGTGIMLVVIGKERSKGQKNARQNLDEEVSDCT